MLKKAKSELGFSLIEVMIAGAILTIVSMALMSVLDSSNKAQKRALNKDSLLNLNNQIRAILSDSTLCRQAFVFPGSTTVFPSNPTINTNYELLQVTALGKNLVTSNAPIPGTTDVSTPPGSATTGLRLRLDGSSASATPGFTNWDATLTIPIVAANQTAMRDLTVSFLMTTQDSSPTVITSCNAIASSVGITEQFACENIMGGHHDAARVPQCRLQQTLVSDTKHRDQLAAIPGGSFLAIEAPVGSRGIASFGAGARIGLYSTEADFSTTPSNGVTLTIPSNNRLQFDASQGIFANGFFHVNRGNAGPTYSLKVSNTDMGVDVFTVDRIGMLQANTIQSSAWNNLGGGTGGADILRAYDSAGATQVRVDLAGNVGIGAGAAIVGKLDVRGDVAGNVVSWGLPAGVQGNLAAGAGSVTLSSTAGNNLNIQSSSAASVTAAAAITITSGTGLSFSSNGGGNTVVFGGADATFSTNINAPTFTVTSDARLKKDIRNVGSVLDKILDVSIYTYSFKKDKQNKKHFGVVAQELKEIWPELVHENESGELSVNYIELIPLLIQSTKETEVRIKDLENKITHLERIIQKLETKRQ